MIGDASEFTPLDLLGSLALNAGMTHLACTHKSGSFRLGMVSKKTGDVPAYADYRFLGGITAAVLSAFAGPTVRRAGHDIASGLLGSYVSTETCRRQSLKRIEAAAAQAPAAQLTADSDLAPQEQTVEQPALAGDFDW